jgi:hypothetical protein
MNKATASSSNWISVLVSDAIVLGNSIDLLKDRLLSDMATVGDSIFVYVAVFTIE